MNSSAPHPSAALSELCSDSHWFPEKIDSATGQVTLVRVERRHLTTPAFLADAWAPPDLPRQTIKLSEAHAFLARGATLPKLNFIWQTAFCCSTAISRAIDVEGRNLSLREPQVLMSLADVKRHPPPGYQFPPDRLQSMFRMLARPITFDEQVTVKPTNAVNCFLPESATMTNGKALLLYGDCRSFLIATAKRREKGRAHHRALFGELCADGHEQRNWQLRKLFELSDLQVSALVWHMQIAQFMRALPLFEPGRVAALTADEFLRDPRSVLQSISRFLHLGLDDDHIGAVVSGPLQVHAKDPSTAFKVDDHRQKEDEVARWLGGELDELIHWSYEVCRTPRALPLPALSTVAAHEGPRRNESSSGSAAP